MRGSEPWQCPGHGLEIVDDVELRETETGGEIGAPEAPGAIGQRDLLALDRSGDGHHRGLRSRAGVLEIARYGCFEVGDGIVLDDDNALGQTRGIDESKAAFAAADIGDKGCTHRGFTRTENEIPSGVVALWARNEIDTRARECRTLSRQQVRPPLQASPSPSTRRPRAGSRTRIKALLVLLARSGCAAAGRAISMPSGPSQSTRTAAASCRAGC